MQESDLRKEIRKVLIEEMFYDPVLITERYGITMQPGEFSKIFFEPWKNVVKGAFIDLKAVASQVLTTVRLMFTLNQKKAEEIVARQKDRLREFDKQSDEVFQALGGEGSQNDFRAIMFIANPGLYVAGRLAAAAPGAGRTVIDTAREIGLGDVSIGTATGEEKEEDALIRRREQDGPVTKALRALEQIFLFAHSENTGALLVENADVSTMTAEIMDGPYGSVIKSAQDSLFETSENLIDVINSITAQNEFMASVAQSEGESNPQGSLKQMSTALEKLKSVDPEAAKTFGDLPKQISDEAMNLSKDDDFQKSELAKVDSESEVDPDFEAAALKAVIGQTFVDLISEYSGAIEDNKNLLLNTINDLFPGGALTSSVIKSIDNNVPGFSTAIKKAEIVLQQKIIS